VARRLAVIFSGEFQTYPPPLDRNRDAPIVAAYSHYANTLVHASSQARLLLKRRQDIINRFGLILEQKEGQADGHAEVVELNVEEL
jgi:hypothetical protein